MAYTHVAHDCMVGNHCIMANNASIAGHVIVGDHVIIGGMSGVHQFCHVGDHSFVAANALVLKDIPAYVMASGHPAKPFGLNSEGLKRRGFSSDIILSIKRAYKEIYRKKQSVDDALLAISEQGESSPELELFTYSIKKSTRGIIR
jgi:UDP-N-acetylglucosamine acyltransferase